MKFIPSFFCGEKKNWMSDEWIDGEVKKINAAKVVKRNEKFINYYYYCIIIVISICLNPKFRWYWYLKYIIIHYCYIIIINISKIIEHEVEICYCYCYGGIEDHYYYIPEYGMWTENILPVWLLFQWEYMFLHDKFPLNGASEKILRLRFVSTYLFQVATKNSFSLIVSMLEH